VDAPGNGDSDFHAHVPWCRAWLERRSHFRAMRNGSTLAP
jgi:hypothetical protein